MPDKRDSHVDWGQDAARQRVLDDLKKVLDYDAGTKRDDLVMITVEKVLDIATQYGQACWDRAEQDKAEMAYRRVFMGEKVPE
jgi:hypothetical protein